MSSSRTNGTAAQPSEDTADGTRPQAIRRKPRMIAICLECRRRKVKCDKHYPCSNCTKFSRECLFLSPAMEMMARQRAEASTLTSAQSGELDRELALETKIIQPVGPELDSSILLSPDHSASWSNQVAGDLTIDEYEHYLEPVPTGAVSVAYGDDYGEPQIDLGVSIGKMWMTDRIGGLFRPHIHKEIDRILRDPASDRRTLVERAGPLASLADEGANFLGPRPDYIEPRLIPSQPHHVGAQREALLDFLPTKSAADTLLERYHANVHSIAPTLHWPTFQHQYGLFWRTVASGLEPAPWLQAMVFATLFAATASTAGDFASTPNIVARIAARDRMQLAAENALCAARLLHATRLEVLQALITLLLPMYGLQISRAHTCYVGMAVSLAETLGLHQEPTLALGMSEIERHVRRLLWFHISTLDLRINHAYSPRLLIREGDYDTRMPLNVDEVGHGTSPPQDGYGWSAMTFCRIRFECIRMQKIVSRDREKLERNEISITHCLGKIESFRKDMESRYGRHFDHSKPIQKYTRLVLNLLVQTCYVQILFRYLKQDGQKVPDRFRQLTLHAAVLAMESAIEMDRSADLVQWKWHNGCYHQWQIAFLLLSHINRAPKQTQAKRIWNIIDYVFDIEPSLSPAMKARSIMTTIASRTRAYQDARRLRTLDRFDANPPVSQVGIHGQHSRNPVAKSPPVGLPVISMTPLRRLEDQADRPESHLRQLASPSGYSIPQPAILPNGSSYNHASTGESQTDQVVAQFACQRVPEVQEGNILPLLGASNQFLDPSLSELPPGTIVHTISNRSHDISTPDSISPWTEPRGQDLEMADVDWTEWDQIFPRDIYTGF